MDTLSSHASNDNIPEKKCTGSCGRTLLATTEFFDRAKYGKYGLTAQCKACKSQEYYNRPKRHEYIVSDEKRCAGPCGRTLPATTEFFCRDKNRKDALYPQCKVCKNADHRKQYRRPEVKEQKRIYQKSWQSRPETRPLQRVYAATYRKRHLEQFRAYKRVYTKIYNRRPDVREKRREIDRVASHNRRARKNAALGTHTPQQIREQYNRQHGLCYYCRQKVKWGKHHADHVVPLSRGGSNDISNIVIACAFCNLSKHDNLPHEWIKGGRLL